MKLKYNEVKQVRESMWQSQACLCAMCSLPLELDEACLDHHHQTGAVRGVCHRGCNSLEGKIANAVKRFGVQDMKALLSGLLMYYAKHETDQTGLIYPSHKTAQEKKAAAAKKRKRAKAKNARK